MCVKEIQMPQNFSMKWTGIRPYSSRTQHHSYSVTPIYMPNDLPYTKVRYVIMQNEKLQQLSCPAPETLACSSGLQTTTSCW
jgi:hypothetical protein